MDKNDSNYFQSYSDLDVHRLMLQDVPRTMAYKEAIEAGAGEAVRGKVVLDVGAGTGILSLFCLRAGAARVYAVEASDLADPLVDIVKANGGEGRVQVIKSRVEDVNLPEMVDVIVSEWMGFYLLHESMLDSVIHARDRFLKPDTGIMMPSHARIYAAPCSMDRYWAENVMFWKNVYGFDMTRLGQESLKLGQGLGVKPQVEVLEPVQILSDPRIFAEFDLATVSRQDLDSLEKRHFVSITREGNHHGIALWFDVDFLPGSTRLSTSPLAPATHWKQTIIVTAIANQSEEDAKVEVDDVIGWELKMVRTEGENKRHYAIQVEQLDPESEAHPVPCDCLLAKCVLIQKLNHLEDEEGIEIMDLE